MLTDMRASFDEAPKLRDLGVRWNWARTIRNRSARRI
jgi:hypothetical protein